MKFILYILLAVTPYSHAMQSEILQNKEQTIFIITNDGLKYQIAPQVAQFLPQINLELKKTSTDTITLKDIDSVIFELINECLEQLLSLSRNASNNFVFKDLTQAIRKIIMYKSEKMQLELLQAAYILNIEPLKNAFSYILAYRFGFSNVEALASYLKSKHYDIDEEIQRRIKKHILFLRMKKNELTIGDLLSIERYASLLTSLSLRGKEITSIDDIACLKNAPLLESLDLSHNCIVLDPQYDAPLISQPFQTFAKLRELNLSNNYIKAFNADFFGDLHLTFLKLSHNQISELPEKIFDSLSHLKKLDLTYNEIKELHNDLLKPLTKLEELILDHNAIRIVSCLLPCSLKKLTLQDNKIEEFPQDLFKRLTQLLFLDISSNYLKQDTTTSFINHYRILPSTTIIVGLQNSPYTVDLSKCSVN